jgi:protocatechuate 3,4-dioxygenase alpha subunit
VHRSPSQTIGPFFAIALPWPEGPFVVKEGTLGAIRLRGRLLDGAAEPVPDGLVEIWQADADGRIAEAADGGFRGFGRCPTDREGGYAFLTVKPGRVHGTDGAMHAPCVLVSVFARGLLKRAVTRIYFPDEEAANGVDPVFSQVADARDRATLMATKTDGGYVFDIRLRGEGETVWFEP